MRCTRVLAPLVVVIGLLASSCGAGSMSAHGATKVMPEPLVAMPSTLPAASTVTWAPVRVAQNQAAALEVAEEQYATCVAYAGLDQSLVTATEPTHTPAVASCSTAGLTPAVAQDIQGLMMQAT